MLEHWSIYLAAGIVVGLGISMLIFSKWNFPAWLKRSMRLNTRVKGLVAVLLIGTLLATLVMMATAALRLIKPASQALEGLTIGFNCAVVMGLLREQENARGARAARIPAKRQSADNRGRRSKG